MIITLLSTLAFVTYTECLVGRLIYEKAADRHSKKNTKNNASQKSDEKLITNNNSE